MAAANKAVNPPIRRSLPQRAVGFLRRHLEPYRLRALAWINPKLAPRWLNIGGGPRFLYWRWLNLDSALAPGHHGYFEFAPTCRFPLSDSCVSLAYSSHCLEHIDDPTVARILAETHRVLADDGDLLIKVPDFEATLVHWKKQDLDYFSSDRWDYDSVSWTWKNHGINDDIDARAAMVFCGYWTAEYGHHFRNDIRGGDRAFHGPPRIERSELQGLFETKSPHEISSHLVASSRREEPGLTFNHQNAWSRKELSDLLASRGFAVVSIDPGEIVARFSEVPGIAAMLDISLYCWARKATSAPPNR